MKKQIIFFLVLVSFLGFSGFAAADAITLPNPLCLGGAGSPGCINDFTTLVTKLTSFVLTILGALASLVIIYAGILYLTSAGNPAQVEKAKNALKYAVIGIVMALL